MLNFLNILIRWSFYAIFALVPLVFTSNTSELFEFNKMWVTFGLTVIIAASWTGKMIIEKQIRIQRTFLDIPLLLFIISQIVSTFLSIDQHTSVWGYYSRFNGGLLSILSFSFLYVAFVSNIVRKDVLRYVYVTIASAVVVALWGLPAHFGYDPTCLLFRGTLDVSCWTFAFQPKVRIFSTLGQPDWLAAYLVYFIPLTTALGLIAERKKKKLWTYVMLATTFLFYLDLLYTKARSGFIGVVAALLVFFAYYIFTEWKTFISESLSKSVKKHTFFLITLGMFAIVTFFVGSPLSQLDRVTFQGVVKLFQAEKTAHQTKTLPAPTAKTQANPITGELGGTDSGKIRLFVWQGAWQVFLHNPLFGTGVETFAYAYYKYRPIGHNLTSEWDYLYNKAHNEYLNYLATTGAFGLLTYLSLIVVFLFLGVHFLFRKRTQQDKSVQADRLDQQFSLREKRLLVAGLLAAYVSILVTNFFGFSVVIMNIFLFLTPAFVFFIEDVLVPDQIFTFPAKSTYRKEINELQWIGIGLVGILLLIPLWSLYNSWHADTNYAMGFNLDRANEYQAAYTYLHDAAQALPSEPTFQDELSVNDAVLAVALSQQQDATHAGQLAQEATQVSNAIIANHPNNVTFWKTRVRVFYTLSQINPQYLALALQAIEKANQLAPTDAKVSYNLGLLYGQTGNLPQAISTLQETTKLKPDYRDAYYALALFQRQAAVDQKGQVIHPDQEANAVSTMHFILNTFGPDDAKILDTLKSWKED